MIPILIIVNLIAKRVDPVKNVLSPVKVVKIGGFVPDGDYL